MRTLITRVAVCGVLVWGALFIGPVDAATGEIRAGVAKERVALPKGIPLAGYSRRKGKPSQGVHDPVGVRALILTDEQTTVALVSCDLLIVDERLTEAVHQHLVARGLSPNLSLFLAATHTHSGPGAYGARFLEKISMGHFDPQVFNAIVHAIAEAVSHAHRNLSPIQMAYGSARTQGLVMNRVEPLGPLDDELITCALYRVGTTTPLAVLVNFAAHPTTLGAWNMQLSADYPGVVVREIERSVPGAIGFFFAGAVGDQAPVKSGSGFERAEWVGQALAAQVIDLLPTLHPTTPGDLAARQEQFMLPPAQVRAGRLRFPRWLGQLLVDDDATLSIVALGDTALIGVPCDVSAELGAQLKQAAGASGFHPMILGFVSDYIGYCVSASLYEAKQYESSMAFNGPRAGELLVQRLTEMIAELKIQRVGRGPWDVGHVRTERHLNE